MHHPKAVPLGLSGERVVAISAAGVRCSVATESGRVATWLDETLADVATKLEQPAQSFPEASSILYSSLSHSLFINFILLFVIEIFIFIVLHAIDINENL